MTARILDAAQAQAAFTDHRTHFTTNALDQGLCGAPTARLRAAEPRLVTCRPCLDAMLLSLDATLAAALVEPQTTWLIDRLQAKRDEVTAAQASAK